MGRNALYKIHVSLGKIVNSLDQQLEAGRRRSTMSRSVSLGPDEHSVAAVGGRAGTAAPEDRAAVEPSEPRIKEEDEEEEKEGVQNAVSRADENDDDSSGEGTVVQNTTTKTEPQEGDSLVSELLDDDGDTIMD